MDFDVFFAISQTPAPGGMPTEADALRAFLAQVRLADELGYGVAWLAESHLSSEVQKRHPQPVIPHWQGEVGLNVDFVQAATRVFGSTRRIEVGSAILNVVCNGGPVAAAERVSAFLGWHGLDPAERRRLHVGFAAGRFEFMNRAYGVRARNELERAAWPVLKGLVFRQAAIAFVRLMRGDALSGADLPPLVLERDQFRSDADWQRVRDLGNGDRIEVAPFYDFDVLQIVPREIRRELLQLVIGSHEPHLQEEVNTLAPVQVFNLSITSPAIIEDTHRRMAAAYHPSGGPWKRSYMPRTVLVFVNETEGATPAQRIARAHDEARAALGAYWKALEGTIDPKRVENAADNAVIGDAETVARQIRERFHPGDRLMLWFDFFRETPERVLTDLDVFARCVAPRVTG
jgi:hypothetical protein